MTTPLQLTTVSVLHFKAAFKLASVPLRPFNVLIGIYLYAALARWLGG